MSLRIHDTFPRPPTIICIGGPGSKEEQTAEMVRGKAISNWSAVFGAPEITVAGKDSRFVGKAVQEFCTARIIIPQAVNPGRRPSFGATERRHGSFRTIIDHVVGNRKPNSLCRKEWGEFAAMATMRLNSKLRQFGGFAPWRRVFGGRPKCRSGRWIIRILGNLRIQKRHRKRKLISY